MSIKSAISFLLVLFLAILMMSCNKKNGQETVLPPDLSPLVNQIEKQLDTEFGFSEQPFDDFVSKRQLPAIGLSAEAKGSEWGSIDGVTNSIQKIFKEHGWEQKFDYSADGPDGTAFGFVKNNNLCQVMLTWEPLPGVEISDESEMAPLSPKQLQYELNLYFVAL